MDLSIYTARQELYASASYFVGDEALVPRISTDSRTFADPSRLRHYPDCAGDRRCAVAGGPPCMGETGSNSRNALPLVPDMLVLNRPRFISRFGLFESREARTTHPSILFSFASLTEVPPGPMLMRVRLAPGSSPRECLQSPSALCRRATRDPDVPLPRSSQNGQRLAGYAELGITGQPEAQVTPFSIGLVANCAPDGCDGHPSPAIAERSGRNSLSRVTRFPTTPLFCRYRQERRCR
jgi:hypothetical protein